jgi:hypothetical protein
MASSQFENHRKAKSRLNFIGKFPGMQRLVVEELAPPKTLDKQLEASPAPPKAVRSDE